jgi:hypothetical protein
LSSSRAVRRAIAWNRSSDVVISERIASSRARIDMMRSCSGRTSFAELRQTSPAISFISPAAESSIRASPSSRTVRIAVSSSRAISVGSATGVGSG